MDGFTWVKNEATGGVPWRCPDAVLEEMADLGHLPCDPPEDIDPAMAEHLAQAAARRATADAAASKSKSTKAAAGGKAEKE